MSRAKLFGAVIAAAFLGVSGIVIHSELAGDSIAGRPAAATAVKGDQAAQRQAEQKSEQQAIDSACTALRKMGGTNKNCPSVGK